MRRVRYAVAMSLDGYVAGPNGEYDWIEMDSGRNQVLFYDLLRPVRHRRDGPAEL